MDPTNRDISGLHCIINKNQKIHIQGRFKIGKNFITSDNELISNKFNDFFINIGPTLAKSKILNRCFSLMTPTCF